MTGSAARSAFVIDASASRTSSARARVSQGRWIRSGSYRSSSSARACTVVAVPATATNVRASPTGTAWADRRAQQPHRPRGPAGLLESADRVEGAAPSCARFPCGSISRARPPPPHTARHELRRSSTDVLHHERAQRWIEPMGASKERQRRSCSPGMISSSEPASSRTADAYSSRFSASRTALVAPTLMRSAPSTRACRQNRASTSTVRARAQVETPGAVDPAAETRDHHVARKLGGRIVGRRPRLRRPRGGG